MMKRFLQSFFLIAFLANTAFAGLNFDRVNDQLSCGTSNAFLTENGALTLSFRIKPRTDGLAGAGRIIGRFVVGGGGTVGPGIRTATTQALRFTVAGGTTLVRLTNNSVLTLNKWNAVALTWDGSTTAANVHIYVNGTEATYATTTNGATPTDNATGTTFIGFNDDNTQAFDGWIDDVAVWTKVLSTKNITDLANGYTRYLPLQIEKASLAAYWTLDQCADGVVCANTFTDISGNGNTCSVVNAMTQTADTVLSYP